MKIAVCDDDQKFLEFIVDRLKKGAQECNASVERVDTFLSGEELLGNQTLDYDLVILDMEMKALDGFETAKKIREYRPEIVLAFCTGVRMPKPEHFEVQPYRYLLKQNQGVFYEKLCELIYKAAENSMKAELDVVQDGKLYKVEVARIAYISRAKHGCTIQLLDNEEAMKCKNTLDEIMERLKVEHFEYAHNSYAVNLQAVTQIGLTQLALRNGEILTISKSKSKSFHQAFADFVGMSYRRNLN